MNVRESAVTGAVLVSATRNIDERGSFQRLFDAAALRRAGLWGEVAETAVSENSRSRTLRGLHYQCEPHPQPKMVSCLRGSVYDVVVDLRPSSPTYQRWEGVNLTAVDELVFIIPAGCAHGFLTLEDHSDVLYHLGTPTVPEAARGIRWDDPSVAVAWPADPVVIAPRDRGYPDHDW